MRYAIDPVQRSRQLLYVRSETEEAEHPVDVDEEDRAVCVIRHWGIAIS